MLLLVLAMLLAANHGCCQEVVRLVNGATRQMGRLEVFVNGEWGTVCDDSFGLQDAHVVCRMLGYPSAVTHRSRAYYGRGTGQIWIDQLACAGNETSIFDCPMNALGDHDCEHKEDVGVECYRPTPTRVVSLPVRLTCPFNKSCKNVARRRGPEPDECTPSAHVEGIVEVYFNETWWPVSADDWDNADVNVICGQLGFPLAFGTVSNFRDILRKGSKVRKREKQAFYARLKTVIMKQVECSGTERELRTCYHFGWGPFDNPSKQVATARCGFLPHSSCSNNSQEQPSYRLRCGTPHPWMGRVEVLHNNEWGTVCDIGFNYQSANVLCRSLGYGTSRTITTRAGYGRGIGTVWMSEVRCTGTELWLHDCKRLPWGESPRCGVHAGDVGVMCNAPDIYYGQPELVHLLPVADARNPGLINNFVEVADADLNYGLLCFDDVDAAMAEVLCSVDTPQYLLAYRQSTHTTYKGQRYKGRFICNGDEVHIRDCHSEFYPTAKCDTGDLVIYCDRGRPDLVPVLSKFETSLRRYPYADLSTLYHLRCAREENCLASDADDKPDNALRKLLRFDSLTMNYGIREFSPLLDRSQWIWHACHNHYHSFEVFVEYDLLSLNGTKVAEGHKASFCLEDSQCDAGGFPRRRCGGFSPQGISVNCGDLYGRHLDCQWIDVTGIPDGFYILQLNVNPSQLVPESDYRNNVLQCNIRMLQRLITVISCSQSDH